MRRYLRIAEDDNVAVALTDLRAGERICCGDADIVVRDEIPRGHKVALCRVAEGEQVIKYGCSIGYASCDILPGGHVHTHNLRTGLSEKGTYVYRPGKLAEEKPMAEKLAAEKFTEEEPLAGGERKDVFEGFPRRDGRVGIRNEIWILPIVGCVNDTAERLASENQDLVTGSVDGIYAFSHPYGCSQTGADHEQTKRLLASLASHPNAGAVLIVGLGCENLTREQFEEALGDYDRERIRFLICQAVRDEFAEGRRLLRQCADYAGQFQRETVPVSELVVGLKCGGSDGLSGITANPAAGRFSDLLVGSGGTAILTEVPEMFGAESILLDRCTDKKVFDRAVSMLTGFKDYFVSHGEVVYENPSPGNKAGGITTLEDKSCGCVQKGGRMPVAGVLDYGCQVKGKGLHLLCGPGNDLVSATALTAAGAHLILFTTGRGTPFGAPAPAVKISTNSALAEKKPGWIDFDAGTVAGGEPLEAAGKRLYDLVLAVASGKRTRSEEMNARGIAIWKDGVTL